MNMFFASYINDQHDSETKCYFQRGSSYLVLDAGACMLDAFYMYEFCSV